MTGMSESAAPKVAIVDSVVIMDVDMPANANGVLYALGGFSGGLTCYMKAGVLNYEYNQFEVLRTKIRSKEKLPAGKVRIEVESRLVDKVGGAMDITLKANGKVVAQGQVPTAISLHFTTNESLDFGSDTFSPVSLDYYDHAPFAFNGTIGTTKITYLKK
jgi:arylsulfatase